MLLTPKFLSRYESNSCFRHLNRYSEFIFGVVIIEKLQPRFLSLVYPQFLDFIVQGFSVYL